MRLPALVLLSPLALLISSSGEQIPCDPEPVHVAGMALHAP